jgi:hypothetical protein
MAFLPALSPDDDHCPPVYFNLPHDDTRTLLRNQIVHKFFSNPRFKILAPVPLTVNKYSHCYFHEAYCLLQEQVERNDHLFRIAIDIDNCSTVELREYMPFLTKRLMTALTFNDQDVESADDLEHYWSFVFSCIGKQPAEREKKEIKSHHVVFSFLCWNPKYHGVDFPSKLYDWLIKDKKLQQMEKEKKLDAANFNQRSLRMPYCDKPEEQLKDKLDETGMVIETARPPGPTGRPLLPTAVFDDRGNSLKPSHMVHKLFLEHPLLAMDLCNVIVDVNQSSRYGIPRQGILPTGNFAETLRTSAAARANYVLNRVTSAHSRKTSGGYEVPTVPFDFSVLQDIWKSVKGAERDNTDDEGFLRCADYMNRYFAYVCCGSKHGIAFYCRDDMGQLHWEINTEKDITNYLKQAWVPVKKKGKLDEVKEVKLFDKWMSSPRRRNADSIVYWPYGEDATDHPLFPLGLDRCINSYTPTVSVDECAQFMDMPEVDIIDEYVKKVLCDKQNDHEVRRFMKNCLWGKGKLPFWLVFQGPQGLLKSHFWTSYGKLFNRNWVQLHNLEGITGKFNTDFVNRLFVLVDDAISEDSLGVNSIGNIKNIITEPRTRTNEKFQKREDNRNCANFVLITNREKLWHIPADERRTAIYRVSSVYKGTLMQDRIFELLTMKENAAMKGYMARLVLRPTEDLDKFTELDMSLPKKDHIMDNMEDDLRIPLDWALRGYTIWSPKSKHLEKGQNWLLKVGLDDLYKEFKKDQQSDKKFNKGAFTKAIKDYLKAKVTVSNIASNDKDKQPAPTKYFELKPLQETRDHLRSNYPKIITPQLIKEMDESYVATVADPTPNADAQAREQMLRKEEDDRKKRLAAEKRNGKSKQVAITPTQRNNMDFYAKRTPAPAPSTSQGIWAPSKEEVSHHKFMRLRKYPSIAQSLQRILEEEAEIEERHRLRQTAMYDSDEDCTVVEPKKPNWGKKCAFIDDEAEEAGSDEDDDMVNEESEEEVSNNNNHVSRKKPRK